MSARRPAIFVIRHGEREDYQWKARGENWQSQAERPWDTPLTEPGGHLQGAAVGRAILRHCDRLGLEPVTQVYVSPLLRCAQTGGAAASVLGINELVVCTALAETMNEDWYRSWGIPGADSTWGGPPGGRCGDSVAREDLHPMALGPSQACLSDAKALQALAHASSPPGACKYTLAEPPVAAAKFASPAIAYSWDKAETHEEQVARMAAMCEGLRTLQKTHPDTHKSAVLVSHGGPTTGLFKALTKISRAPNTGYTGLFCYTWSEGDGNGESGGWEALIVADHEHLNEVDGASKSGPSDMVEQAP